eukprot:SAG22_NODE_22_length_31438_cov_47.016529_14_plen_176_part_00
MVPARWLAVAAASVLLHCSGGTETRERPSPLTEIAPTAVELSAFADTAVGALAKLELPAAALPVVHVLGASAVEDAVDWSLLCERGAKVHLVGPQAVVPRAADKGGSSCVAAVEGLYSKELVKDLPPPDVVLLHNADVYMPYWRRTLAELLQLRVPIVLTMYCEYEVPASANLPT